MDIKTLYETTDLSIKEIGILVNRDHTTVWHHVAKIFPSDFRKARHLRLLSKSKLGVLNPSYGKSPHNYVGDVIEDGKGYLMVLKPTWFLGRKGSLHIFQHHEVVCRELELTHIPAKWCVHHCDENKMNNSFDNLVLMTMGDHQKLHNMLKSATTISKESTLKWVEAHGTPFKRDDIVSSAWEHAAASTDAATT